MTEAEWLACDDRKALQSFLLHHPYAPRHRNIERRLKLHTCACCRLIWDTFPADVCRQGVVIAEAYADGEVGAAELVGAHAVIQNLPQPASAGSKRVDTPFGSSELPTGPQWEAQMASFYATSEPGGRYPAGETLGTASGAMHGPACVIRAAKALGLRAKTRRTVLAIFRDVFGNPFHPVSLDLRWRTSDTLALGRRMYESRDFGPMPILADALQEAGCDNDDILHHCRQPGVHVRGCWVVDLVIDRE
jgi:hypothetical protein